MKMLVCPTPVKAYWDSMFASVEAQPQYTLCEPLCTKAVK